jgi:hypothetical protein
VPKPNDWQSRFGARRRAKDKALLAALEKQIAAEDRQQDAERKRIAQAFGRPLQ